MTSGSSLKLPAKRLGPALARGSGTHSRGNSSALPPCDSVSLRPKQPEPPLAGPARASIEEVEMRQSGDIFVPGLLSETAEESAAMRVCIARVCSLWEGASAFNNAQSGCSSALQQVRYSPIRA